MGPAFRQWHGTGPDPVQRLAVADDCGPVWWQSRWVAGSPVGWDHLWRCGGILSVGHPSGAAAGSPGPQGSARRAERSEPLWSWRFWGRLRCRAGKMPAAWRPSWREGRGAGQRPGDLPGAVVSGPRRDGWFLPVPVGLAVEDQFVGGGLEPVDRGLGEQRVGHQGQPFGRFAVGGGDGGCGPVPFDDDLVDVGGVGGVHRLQAEVVQDQQVHPQEFADLLVVAVVEPGGLQPLVQLLRSG